MEIFETLRNDHAVLRDLLDQLIDKTEPDQGTLLSPIVDQEGADWPVDFHDLKLALVAHNRAEEAVFYDLLNRIPHRTELAELKTEEHHMAEELLEDLEEINPADRTWNEKLSLFKNQIESHIAEEETMVFSLIQPLLDEEEAERLGQEFSSLRDDIIEGAPYHPRGRSDLNPAGLDLNS
jgi:hemerythrin-like domain-containing protein